MNKSKVAQLQARIANQRKQLNSCGSMRQGNVVGELRSVPRNWATTTLPPRIITKGNRTVITGCEPIMEVQTGTTSDTYNVAFPYASLNPSVTERFRWASGLVSCYSQYKFLRCRLFFVGQMPTTQAGNISLGVFYEFNDMLTWRDQADLDAKLRTLQVTWPNVTGPLYGNYTTGEGNNPMSAEIDCTRLRANWYTCNNDAFISNAGKNQGTAFYIAIGAKTSGLTGPTILGQVYCEYEVELQHPVAPAINNSLMKTANLMPNIRDADAANNAYINQLGPAMGSVKNDALAVKDYVLTNYGSDAALIALIDTLLTDCTTLTGITVNVSQSKFAEVQLLVQLPAWSPNYDDPGNEPDPGGPELLE